MIVYLIWSAVLFWNVITLLQMQHQVVVRDHPINITWSCWWEQCGQFCNSNCVVNLHVVGPSNGASHTDFKCRLWISFILLKWRDAVNKLLMNYSCKRRGQKIRKKSGLLPNPLQPHGSPGPHGDLFQFLSPQWDSPFLFKVPIFSILGLRMIKKSMQSLSNVDHDTYMYMALTKFILWKCNKTVCIKWRHTL